MDSRRQRQDASFGETHFGKAQLGDARRTRRLVKTADLIMHHPGGTLPQKLNQWSDLMGLYRLLSAPRVTHQAVMQSHCERTLQRAGEAAPQRRLSSLQLRNGFREMFDRFATFRRVPR